MVSSTVIVNDLNLPSMRVMPNETNSPLIVDPQAMLSRTIASQKLKAVQQTPPRWSTSIAVFYGMSTFDEPWPMKSKNLDYLPALDHLRLLAASLVFAFHAYHQTVGGWKSNQALAAWGFITEGHTGVTLFFCAVWIFYLQRSVFKEPFAMEIF